MAIDFFQGCESSLAYLFFYSLLIVAASIYFFVKKGEVFSNFGKKIPNWIVYIFSFAPLLIFVRMLFNYEVYETLSIIINFIVFGHNLFYYLFILIILLLPLFYVGFIIAKKNKEYSKAFLLIVNILIILYEIILFFIFTNFYINYTQICRGFMIYHVFMF